jgi:type IV pilus biogenesis protein CpaD/CtpE
MKSILLATLITLLTGCASTEWATTQSRYGYRAEDPCIRCGEKWDVIHRHPFTAQCENGQPWLCK